ncbi:hypothetical protein AOB60_01875 [Streptomyces noursei]|uniref:Uncharacterized protein n=1 Tax=Streptomyces noursei TaxID=1971 RepID=A0A2N8PFX6_STRNR|nr:hypothetical protein AOB60_01875 [Streptomyces noursei]
MRVRIAAAADVSLFGLMRAWRKILHCLIREIVRSTGARSEACTLFDFLWLSGSSVPGRRLMGVMTVPPAQGSSVLSWWA